MGDNRNAKVGLEPYLRNRFGVLTQPSPKSLRVQGPVPEERNRFCRLPAMSSAPNLLRRIETSPMVAGPSTLFMCKGGEQERCGWSL
jgi:hypothetical protein